MQSEREYVYRATVGIVAGVEEELVIGGEP